MPSQSQKIRMTLELPNELYYAMHAETVMRGQTHSAFLRHLIYEACHMRLSDAKAAAQERQEACEGGCVEKA